MTGHCPLHRSMGNIRYHYLSSKRYPGCGRLFAGQSTQYCYLLGVNNSDHDNFTGFSVYPDPKVRFLPGPIEGKRTIEMMNIPGLGFFDKYLCPPN